MTANINQATKDFVNTLNSRGIKARTEGNKILIDISYQWIVDTFFANLDPKVRQFMEVKHTNDGLICVLNFEALMNAVMGTTQQFNNFLGGNLFNG